MIMPAEPAVEHRGITRALTAATHSFLMDPPAESWFTRTTRNPTETVASIAHSMFGGAVPDRIPATPTQQQRTYVGDDYAIVAWPSDDPPPPEDHNCVSLVEALAWGAAAATIVLIALKKK